MSRCRYKDLLFIVGKESNEVYYVLMDEVNYNYRLSSLVKLAIEFSLLKLLSLNKNLVLRTYNGSSCNRGNWIFKPGRTLHYYFCTVSFVTGDRRFDWIGSEERDLMMFNYNNPIKNHGHYIIYKRGEATYKAEKKRNGHKFANKLIDLVNIFTFRLK
jgi:hypothetical protein